ncbi:MAG: hypothetical protein RIA64_11580 [Rhodospirillales bacterium]
MASQFAAAEDEAFVSPKCRRLLSYWRDKAGGRVRAAWRDINLIDLYDIAPFITVRDVVDGGREFRCRYCGTGLVEVTGFELTGGLLSENYAPAGAEIMLKRYRATIDAGGPLRIVGFLRTVEKNLPTGFESVTLPLDGDSGTIAHILSVHDFDYEPRLGEINGL